LGKRVNVSNGTEKTSQQHCRMHSMMIGGLTGERRSSLGVLELLEPLFGFDELLELGEQFERGKKALPVCLLRTGVF
jgi:hypothetical protein